MRLSPPVAGGLPRAVLEGGLTIDNNHIPAGVDVCVPHYAIHHNDAYFPHPFEFMPERWIRDQAPASLVDRLDAAHSAFCPFSVGPRGCIGKGLAYVELSVTLARVLFAFDMRLTPGTSVGEGRPDLEVGRRRIMGVSVEGYIYKFKGRPRGAV